MSYLTYSWNPSTDEAKQLFTRKKNDDENIREGVQKILDDIRRDGEKAVRDYTLKFDKVEPDDLFVSEDEFLKAERNLDPELKKAVQVAYSNIYKFHKAQMPEGEKVSVMEGIDLGRKIVPYSKVGLYVPGGTAPLFSTVLMLAIPAQIAGCREVILATPPQKDGRIHDAILYCARISGVRKVLKCGGAVAIGALAYIYGVDKIFGPGNRYVAYAKQLVSVDCCAIDMMAGPSEVMVMSDVTADPRWVASDLLSQAEHGMDSQSILLIRGSREETEKFYRKVEDEIDRMLGILEREKYLRSSLSYSHAVGAESTERMIELANLYAPEHLIINTDDCDEIFEKIENAGSVFLGPYSCESAGDYASGTNHTLPTSGWAKSTGGVSLDSFIKKITVQKLSRQGLRSIADTVMTMAENELLGAHRMAVEVRLDD